MSLRTSDLVACHLCDLLIDARLMEAHKSYHCPRCAHKISHWHSHTPQRVTALASSALILFYFAMSFPFMTLTNSGVSHSMSLFSAAAYLIAVDYTSVAILMVVCLFVFPLLMIVCSLVLHIAVLAKYSFSAQQWLLKILFTLLPWSMIEVFLVGALVSIIKILGLASLSFNTGFWAFIAFNLLFTIMLSHLDQYGLWRAFSTFERLRHES